MNASHTPSNHTDFQYIPLSTWVQANCKPTLLNNWIPVLKEHGSLSLLGSRNPATKAMTSSRFPHVVGVWPAFPSPHEVCEMGSTKKSTTESGCNQPIIYPQNCGWFYIHHPSTSHDIPTNPDQHSLLVKPPTTLLFIELELSLASWWPSSWAAAPTAPTARPCPGFDASMFVTESVWNCLKVGWSISNSILWVILIRLIIDVLIQIGMWEQTGRSSSDYISHQ